MSDSDAFEEEMDRLWVQYSNGDGICALYAITQSHYCGRQPPYWAVRVLADALIAHNGGTVATLDEALGMQRPKGWRQRTHRKKNEVSLTAPFPTGRMAMIAAVERLMAPVEDGGEGREWSPATELAGVDFGVDGATVRNWLAEVGVTEATIRK